MISFPRASGDDPLRPYSQERGFAFPPRERG